MVIAMELHKNEIICIKLPVLSIKMYIFVVNLNH